jgi:N-acetylmuramoyl-L-alanine amidase
MTLTAVLAFSICATAAGQHKNFILVIDAGHGGQDPGATHGRYLEKDLNLDVALSLGALVTRRMPGVDVLYTRTEDRAVGLADRGNFANRAGADLFVSIHTNANHSATANGSETYVMGMDKSDDNLAVAKLENEVMRYEKDYTETYAAFDPSSTEMSIIMGMMQYANFEGSLEFARLVQRHFATGTPLRDRGAKQGPFAVLWKPTMPRVLVETGFISNDSDRRYIFSERGKAAVVEALFKAFREYKADLDAGAAPVLVQTPPPAPPVQAPADQTPAVQAPVVLAPVIGEEPPRQPSTAAPAQEVNRIPLQPAREDTPPQPVREESPYLPLEFYIQLSASRTGVSTNDPWWGPYRGVVVEKIIDGWYKYYLGPYTQSGAAAKLIEVRRTKFNGAFVVKQ